MHLGERTPEEVIMRFDDGRVRIDDANQSQGQERTLDELESGTNWTDSTLGVIVAVDRQDGGRDGSANTRTNSWNRDLGSIGGPAAIEVPQTQEDGVSGISFQCGLETTSQVGSTA